MNIQRSLECSCNVLSGAQAPQNWRRKLSGEISRLGDLQRGCSWVDDLAFTNIKLRDEPLWGTCLESLCGVQPTIQPKVAPPHNLQQSESPPIQKQKLSKAKPFYCPAQIKPKETIPAVSTSQPNLNPLQLAPKVKQEKLCDFARDVSITNSRTNSLAKKYPKTECEQNSTLKSQALAIKQLPKIPASTKNISQNVENRLEKADFDTCRTTEKQQQQQQWLRKKSRDVWNSLYRKQLSKYSVSPFKQTQEEQDKLEKVCSHQFALPLDGKTASWEVLVNLVNLQNKSSSQQYSNHQNSSNRNQKSYDSSITSSSKKSDKPSLIPQAYRQKSEQTSEQKAEDIFSQSQYPLAPTIPSKNRKISKSRTIPNLSPSKVFASSAMENSSIKPATTTTFINSSVSESAIPISSNKIQDINPPLSPLQQEETSKVNPTNELNQQIIKQQESPLDDLNLLADKIKQILDEEARRHGINV